MKKLDKIILEELKNPRKTGKELKILEKKLPLINKNYKNKVKLRNIINTLKNEQENKIWDKILKIIKENKNHDIVLKKIYDVYFELQGLSIDEHEGEVEMSWQEKRAKFKKILKNRF